VSKSSCVIMKHAVSTRENERISMNIHEKMTQRPRVIKVLGRGQHSGKGD